MWFSSKKVRMHQRWDSAHHVNAEDTINRKPWIGWPRANITCYYYCTIMRWNTPPKQPLPVAITIRTYIKYIILYVCDGKRYHTSTILRQCRTSLLNVKIVFNVYNMILFFTKTVKNDMCVTNRSERRSRETLQRIRTLRN